MCGENFQGGLTPKISKNLGSFHSRGKGGAVRATKYGNEKDLPVLNKYNPKKNKRNNKSANPTSPKGTKAPPPHTIVKYQI